MSDGIFNISNGTCEDADDMDIICEEVEVECYNECNGFCTVSFFCAQCPYDNEDKVYCENYEETK